MKEEKYFIGGISPSVRLVCNNLRLNRSLRMSFVVGEDIHFVLKNGTDINGRIDEILADTAHGMFFLSVDADTGYFSDIRPEEIAEIYLDDCEENCPVESEKIDTTVKDGPRVVVTTKNGPTLVGELSGFFGNPQKGGLVLRVPNVENNVLVKFDSIRKMEFA